jgi:hypothetical protein
MAVGLSWHRAVMVSANEVPQFERVMREVVGPDALG